METVIAFLLILLIVVCCLWIFNVIKVKTLCLYIIEKLNTQPTSEDLTECSKKLIRRMLRLDRIEK